MKKQKKNNKRTTKGLLAYHIALSLVSIAPHPHTGRSMHHRHTSHGVLLMALLLTGVLLFSNLGALRAFSLTSSGANTITVNVAGTPPTIGADITYPATHTITRSPQIQVVGTCQATTLVATYNNGVFAGSSMCTANSDYAITIQLLVGLNTLQSQDYDGLNQPGPVTAQVQITREQDPVPVTATSPSIPSDPAVPVVAKRPSDVRPNPTPIVVAPAAQPADNPCFSTSKSDVTMPTNPTIIANCINRSIFAGQTIVLPIRVAGGSAPFALAIDWGDGLTELKSMADTDYHNYEHTYRTAGILNVTLKTTDNKGATSFLQTVVQVNGDGATSSTGAAPSRFATIAAGLGSIWTEAPVPLYWAAVTLVLGFWVGDVFQRFFAKGKYSTQRSFPKSRRQRHA